MSEKYFQNINVIKLRSPRRLVQVWHYNDSITPPVMTKVKVLNNTPKYTVSLDEEFINISFEQDVVGTLYITWEIEE